MTPELQTSRVNQTERGIREVFNAGQGCMTLVVLTAATSVSLVVAAANGDATARLMLSTADRMLRQIQRRSRARALPCLLCADGALWRCEAPAAIAVLVPYGVKPVRTAIAMAICASCAADRSEADLPQAAVAKLRSHMMPDLRVLPAMIQQAGHA